MAQWLLGTCGDRATTARFALLTLLSPSIHVAKVSPRFSVRSKDGPLRTCERVPNAVLAKLAILPVRLIVGISLLLVGFGTLLCQVDALSAKAPELAADSNWVRTVDGWERHGSWNADIPAGAPVHPVVLAAGQMLASVLALAVFQSSGRAATRWQCC